MKTPEEIKYGLECCTPKWMGNLWKACSRKCPYITLAASCRGQLAYDALVYIQQLEQINADFAERMARLEARVRESKNPSNWISAINPPKNTSDYLVNVWVGYPDGISGMELRSAVYNTVTKQWTVHHDRLEAIGIPTHWQELPSPPHGGKHD